MFGTDRRCAHSHQYQQSAGRQQRNQSAAGGLQPPGGGDRAPVQSKALLAVPVS